MNIQKSNLLLLDKIKFAAKEDGTQAPVPGAETEKSPEAGMKALTFMGMKNLMSNPALAQKLGVEGEETTEKNVAFGRVGAIKNATGALLVGTAALLATSCTEKETIREYEKPSGEPVQVTVINNIDLSFLSDIMTYWQERDAKQDAKDAETKAWMQSMYNLFASFYTDFQVYAADEKQFRQKVLENQQTMIGLLTAQGMSIAEATEAINNILNSNLRIEQKMDLLNSLVASIDNNVSKLVEYADRAEKSRGVLLALAQSTNVSVQTLVNQGELALQNDSVLIAHSELLADKLDKLDEDQIRGDQSIVRMLLFLGWTQERIAKANKDEIVAAINENTQATKDGDDKIAAAIDKADTDINAAKAEIIDALNRIDGHIVELTEEVKKIGQAQQMYNFMALAYAKQTAMNTASTAFNTYMTNIQLAKLNDAVDSVIVNNNNYSAKLDEIVKAIETADANNQAGLEDVKKAIKQAKNQLLAFGYTQAQLNAMSDAQILAELKKQSSYLKDIANDVKTLKTQQKQGQITAEQYAKEVVELLKGIKADVASMTLAVIDLSNNVKESAGKYDDVLNDIKNNTYHSSYYNKKLYEAYAAEKADREAWKVATEELLPSIKNIDGTTTNIYNALKNMGLDAETVERFFKILNEHQEERNGKLIDAANANKDEIIAAIEALQDDMNTKMDLSLEVQGAILEKIKEISDKIDNGTPDRVDLTKIEKTLDDILAKLRDGVDVNSPNYTKVLNQILAKIPAGCNCGDLHASIDVIIELLEEIANPHEGIQAKQRAYTYIAPEFNYTNKPTEWIYKA